MNEPVIDQPVTRTQSVINRSAVKAYALKVSREKRANKFKRVGEGFLDSVEADVETVIRQIALGLGLESITSAGDDREFITGAALDKMREKLNERAKRIVHGKVMRHPSVGVTLQD